VPPYLVCWLRWELTNFLPVRTWNSDPLNLYLLSSGDYRHVLPCPEKIGSCTMVSISWHFSRQKVTKYTSQTHHQSLKQKLTQWGRQSVLVVWAQHFHSFPVIWLILFSPMWLVWKELSCPPLQLPFSIENWHSLLEFFGKVVLLPVQNLVFLTGILTGFNQNILEDWNRLIMLSISIKATTAKPT
jgi:hypothetical protein